MKTTKINSWKTKIRIKDKVFYIENPEQKRREHQKSRLGLVVSRLILFFGCVLALIGILILISIVGRQDMISDIKIVDSWGIVEYILSFGLSIILLVSGSIISYISLKLEQCFISEFNESR